MKRARRSKTLTYSHTQFIIMSSLRCSQWWAYLWQWGPHWRRRLWWCNATTNYVITCSISISL